VDVAPPRRAEMLTQQINRLMETFPNIPNTNAQLHPIIKARECKPICNLESVSKAKCSVKYDVVAGI
jgi:hypothetical protein